MQNTREHIFIRRFGMEKLSDMLSKRQLEKVKKMFRNVSEGTMLLSLGKCGDTQVYEEVGSPYRWRFAYKNNAVVRVYREKS